MLYFHVTDKMGIVQIVKKGTTAILAMKNVKKPVSKMFVFKIPGIVFEDASKGGLEINAKVRS